MGPLEHLYLGCFFRNVEREGDGDATMEGLRKKRTGKRKFAKEWAETPTLQNQKLSYERGDSHAETLAPPTTENKSRISNASYEGVRHYRSSTGLVIERRSGTSLVPLEL